jgi:hypothetical protein
MNRTLINLAIFSSITSAVVPHVFKSGSPAKADEINENFALVDTSKANRSEFLDSIKMIRNAGVQSLNTVTTQYLNVKNDLQYPILSVIPTYSVIYTSQGLGYYYGLGDEGDFSLGFYRETKQRGLWPSITLTQTNVKISKPVVFTGALSVNQYGISLPTDILTKGYQLPNLDSLSTYIQANTNLPGLQTPADAGTNGIDLVNLNIQMLRKIEELTLIVIQQNNRIKALEAK